MRSLKNALLCITFLVAILFSTAMPLSGGETVSNQQLGFRLTVPDGFMQAPEKVKGDVVYAFERLPAADQKMGTFILVSRLGGVLGRKKIDSKEISATNPQITITTEKWKDFEIEVFRAPEKTDNLQILTFNAQVPLKPEAVQISIIGEMARENELQGFLRSVLNSLEGSTNWLNADQRVSKFAEGITRLTITIGLLITFVVGAMAITAIIVWFIVRKSAYRPRRRNSDTTTDCPRE